MNGWHFMSLNSTWKHYMSLKDGLAHFTKYTTTVTVYEAMSNSHAQVTSSVSGPVCSSTTACCALQPLLIQVSIFNWTVGGCAGDILPQPWMDKITHHNTNRGCCSWNAQAFNMKFCETVS